MKNSVLNARLLSAAELVRQDATFADIGTDHAYLPLFLLENQRIKYAFCSDINEGPLASAERNARGRQMLDKTEFILTDGAGVLAGKGITDYAICGMGGELIAHIIDNAPHLKDSGVNLILQPMSRQAFLRKYLVSHGFDIKCESYSFDSGKYYVCLLASYNGKEHSIDNIEAELGINGADYHGRESRIGYIKNILSARCRAFEGKLQGGIENAEEKKLIDALEQLLAEL
jgi:tRNA (adenine22-N1)-methyltransferase